MAHKLSLIASDLDGTLLLNGAQKLQPHTCELIQKIIDKGIIFVAASGRQYANLRRLFAPVKNKIGYVCENGCSSYFDNKLISRETMDKNLAHEIIRTFINNGNHDIFASGKDTCYIQSDRKKFAQFMIETVHYDVTLIDDIFNIGEEYSKISINDENVVNNAQNWHSRFGDRCSVQVSGIDWLDFMPKNVSKWTAFEQLIKHLNIEAADCIMFGDNYNDYEILSKVGCPITMQTAKADIRSLGKFTTDTVENALIKILDGNGFDW